MPPSHPAHAPTADGRVPLVDVHAHFVTDDYVAEARRAGHDRPDGMPDWPRWDAGEHVSLMDEWGVGVSVLSISSPGTHFGDDAVARELSRHVNERGREIVRAHPGRFGHFASLPLPDVDGALAEAAHALDELGSVGVAIETNADGIYLADPRFEPLWRELDRRRAVVFVHPTSPPCYEAVSLERPRPMLEFMFDSTRAVADLVLGGVLTRHPEIRWLFTHSASALPVLADRIELFRQTGGGEDGPGAVEQIARLWFDIAGTPFPRCVPALVAAFGEARLLYGSDYCFTPAPAVSAQIDSIDEAAPPTSRPSWRALTRENANRLLTRLERAEAD